MQEKRSHLLTKFPISQCVISDLVYNSVSPLNGQERKFTNVLFLSLTMSSLTFHEAFLSLLWSDALVKIMI